jgi:hypothetical protein
VVRKLFFIFFGVFTLICCVCLFIYGGYSSLIFLPLGLSLFITGIKLQTNNLSSDRKRILLTIKFYLQGKSEEYIKKHT